MYTKIVHKIFNPSTQCKSYILVILRKKIVRHLFEYKKCKVLEIHFKLKKSLCILEEGG